MAFLKAKIDPLDNLLFDKCKYTFGTLFNSKNLIISSTIIIFAGTNEESLMQGGREDLVLTIILLFDKCNLTLFNRKKT